MQSSGDIAASLVMRHVLFISWTCYLDDANGASVASRAMLEALVRQGVSVEVLCGSVLERRDELDVVAFLQKRGMCFDVSDGGAWDVGMAGLRPQLRRHLRLEVRGVPITVMATSTVWRAPTDEECREFLRLYDEVWEQRPPDVGVTYGDRQPILEVLRRARARGAATVFPLHNLGYRDPAVFADVDSVVVASQFAAAHYKAALGLDCTVIPNLVDFERVRAADRQPAYVVFVNPTIEKGVALFARIADELGKTRPDIPFLVVEGRGTEADVAACGLDLRAHGNVFFHEHTSDPRRFWRLARICLLPSLVAENQPLVAVEAMINGVPVIGSDRGGENPATRLLKGICTDWCAGKMVSVHFFGPPDSFRGRPRGR
jgi:glycosyltransferase involved in cell wall biosynthesis